jgi:glycosyltransferase involved in cell wall biosynthesis
MSTEKLKVLAIEPYYGGSHQRFLAGLGEHMPVDMSLMTLPARKWKWRMRLSAPHFARELAASGQRADLLLCSTFLDLAAFRGLAPSWVNDVPVLTYFHENQFDYPVQAEDERDFHFALTNVTTALASDSIAFNSHYNMDSFLEGATGLLRHAGDMGLGDSVESLRFKARVLPPGVDYTEIDGVAAPLPPAVPVILWNHRWEHDKDPEGFFEALYALDEDKEEFGLVVLGESFERRPDVFDEARERLSHRVVWFGYAEQRGEYARWLKRGTIAVSTARHEFFGLAVLEAVRAGCRPLLPRRLSYPELFPDVYLYEPGELLERLRGCLRDGGRLSTHEARRLTDAFSWERLAPAYAEWFTQAVSPPRAP